MSGTKSKEYTAEEAREVLKSYRDGKKIEEEHLDLLRSYESIGVVHIGFSFTKKESQAKLTSGGKRILGLE
jgi:hypothetical protein